MHRSGNAGFVVKVPGSAASRALWEMVDEVPFSIFRFFFSGFFRRSFLSFFSIETPSFSSVFSHVNFLLPLVLLKK